MNYKLLVDTALLTGEIMLSCGAETYRVEDTMCRILKISGLDKTEAFVMTTGIFATLSGEGMEPITLIRRVDKRSTNLNRIYLANNVSRRLCSGELEIKDAFEELKEIQYKEQYKDKVVWIAMVFSTVFFSVLLGGELKDCLLAGFNGCFLVLCMMLSKKVNMNFFVTNMAASFIVALCTMIFEQNLPFVINTEIIITGSIMPLVPGVAITNAIRDTLQGDYMAGGAKAIEAFIIAMSIAVGIGAGLGFFSFVGGVLL